MFLTTYIRARFCRSTDACVELAKKNPKFEGLAKDIISAKQARAAGPPQLTNKLDKYRSQLNALSPAQLNRSSSVISVQLCSAPSHQGCRKDGDLRGEVAKAVMVESDDNTSLFSFGAEECEVLDSDEASDSASLSSFGKELMKEIERVFGGSNGTGIHSSAGEVARASSVPVDV